MQTPPTLLKGYQFQAGLLHPRKVRENHGNRGGSFGIFAAFAEFGRKLIAERTNAGLAAARARGRMDGRPRKMDRAALMMAMAAMADRKAVAAEVAVTTTTLYAYVNGDGTPKAAGQAVLDGTHRPGTSARARTRPRHWAADAT